MNLEIERKFLVTGGWRNGAQRSLLPGIHRLQRSNCALAPRWTPGLHDRQRSGARDCRPEFEYAIPIEDAEVMLRTLCVRPLVEKTRYTVRHGSHDWMVDVFAGANAGLVLAEIELTQADVFCASGLDGSGSDP